MFDCRACGANVLALLFENGGPSREGQLGQARQDLAPVGPQTAHKKKVKLFKNGARFRVRSEDEIQELVKEWTEYVHPRARELFKTEDMLLQTLAQLARGIEKHSDPVLGTEDRCACWVGTVTESTMKPAISMLTPGQTKETYVNRLLAFIFADDESFESLSQLPQNAFDMVCRNKLCVNMAHISHSPPETLQ